MNEPVQPIAVDVIRAAAMLSMHPQTLRKYIRRGELRARRFGNTLRIRVKDLERFANTDHAPAWPNRLGSRERAAAKQHAAAD